MAWIKIGDVILNDNFVTSVRRPQGNASAAIVELVGGAEREKSGTFRTQAVADGPGHFVFTDKAQADAVWDYFIRTANDLMIRSPSNTSDLI